jgi:hypothetical protein
MGMRNARSRVRPERALRAALLIVVFVPAIVASSLAGDAAARATTFTTKITRATISSASRSATFYFVASGGVATGFKCALIPKGQPSRQVSCLSPKAYTTLALHSYTFDVYAQHCNATVCANSTTAQRSFRIN